MTFPLKPNAYRYGNLDPEVLKDVVDVSIAFNRYSDYAKKDPYTDIHFHIDNMKLDGHVMWDNFEAPNHKKKKEKKSSSVIEYNPPGSDLIIGLSEKNGAIEFIKNKVTGRTVSEGNKDGNLWDVTFVNEKEMPSLESSSFYANNDNYNFAFDQPSGKLYYYHKAEDNQKFNLDVEFKATSKNEIEIKTYINNRTNYDIRKVTVAKKLCVETSKVKEALWPIQEGMILLPSFFKEERSSIMARPPMFADLMAFNTEDFYLGTYLIQNESFHRDLIPHHPKDQPVFQPSNLCIGGEGDMSYMHFEMVTYIKKGQKWKSPGIRIVVDKNFKELAEIYRNGNGFDNTDYYPSLKMKVGSDKYQSFKESPIYTVEMYKTIHWDKCKEGESWKTLRESWVPQLINKGILHLTHWQYGRDGNEYEHENHKLEDDHPEALPIWWSRYGSAKEFYRLLKSGKEQGFTFMPFTNWTVWNKIDPLTNRIPPLEEMPMATTKIRGLDYPYYEYRGYMIKPWDDQVRATNDRMLESYTHTYPQDYLFIDMTGERSWRYILSDDGNPSSALYTQSVINENMRMSKKKPLFTEGVGIIFLVMSATNMNIGLLIHLPLL